MNNKNIQEDKEKIFPYSSNNLNIINLKRNINKEFIGMNPQENTLEDFSSSFSIINDNVFREKYKLLNKAKISLENELELLKSENNTYKTEINKMKQMISELRMQNSQSNEELLKLEIDSLKIELNKRINEIQTLKQEKQNMSYKINMYEKNLNEINNNNKIFREKAEERFSQYQKEIESLRNDLNIERSKEKLIRKKSEEKKMR